MAYKGTGGVYHMSLPTIASVVSKKIGDKINTSMYNVQFIGLQPDDSGWYYHDGLRSRYADYREYIDEVYTPHEVPITEFTTFSTPFKTLDSAFGDARPDTMMATIGRTAAKDTLYRTYSAKQLHDKVYHGKGITRGTNATLGLVGYLNGFSVSIDPDTGRAGDLDYMSSTYANYTNDVVGAPNTENLMGYFKIDPGFSHNYFITPTELAQKSVEALRQNLFTGENPLAGVPDGIGNKYRNVSVDGKDGRYREGNYLVSAPTGSLREDETHEVVYREAEAIVGGEASPISESWSIERLLGRLQQTVGVHERHMTGSQLIEATNNAFKQKRYKTLVSRFCTSIDDAEVSETQTAVDKVYGLSHGRNLLTKNAEDGGEPDKSLGYVNPYCRVWTNHHEYSTYRRLIRPFSDQQAKSQQDAGQKKDWDLFRSTSGSTLLDEYSVLDFGTNTIRFSPTHEDNGNYNNDVKRCMFSIENLAWKGQTQHLFEDQKGPFGGRIMWFPPYGLTFNENTSVEWAPHSFIGRGEKIYTYVDSERRGNIDFNIIIDHPAIVNAYKGNAKISDNDLLRFYAGCDIPELKPQPEPDRYRVSPKEIEKIKKESNKLMFAVFYPNNYSGTEEITDKGKRTDENTDVNYPIMYLLNGVGTGEYYNATTKQLETIPYRNDVSGGTNWFASYELITEGDTDTLKPDSPTKVKVVDNKKVKTGRFNGGFEMGRTSNLGISVCNKALPVSNVHSAWKPNVQIVGDSETKLGYSYNICKKGDKTYVLSGIPTSRDHTDDGLWFYRVDKYYRVPKKWTGKDWPTLGGEILAKDQYADLTSYGLNSVLGLETVKKHVIHKDGDNIVSFADMARAIMPQETSGMDSSYYSQDNVRLIQDIVSTDKYVIEKIDVHGVASSQGHSAKNVKWLAPGRAKTVVNWLNEWLSPYNTTRAEVRDNIEKDKVFADITKISSNEANSQGPNDNSALSIKLDKCAIATIYFKSKDEHDADVQAIQRDRGGEFTVGEGGSFSTYAELESQYDPQVYTIERITPAPTKPNKELRGYGNEYKFFSSLEKDNPLIFNRLKEKIRYFEPAYHSISPEGYVERLNFLNQCTRQGATNTGNGGAANNLAFGRAPVCVLRIGDFFYTKILITSVSIDYSETTWDMNPEGAGVQPMYAKVSIQFIFQGGSDISGPVSRLQDAMSFNYYANMGVTSEYAERMERDKTGKVIGIHASPINRKQ